ncbi:hypothetical protein MNBD_GAMMA03-822, partial [hydrothermal vent metagenome]
AAIKFLKKSADKIRWGGQIIKPAVMDLITPEMVIAKIDGLFSNYSASLGI